MIVFSLSCSNVLRLWWMMFVSLSCYRWQIDFLFPMTCFRRAPCTSYRFTPTQQRMVNKNWLTMVVQNGGLWWSIVINPTIKLVMGCWQPFNTPNSSWVAQLLWAARAGGTAPRFSEEGLAALPRRRPSIGRTGRTASCPWFRKGWVQLMSHQPSNNLG